MFSYSFSNIIFLLSTLLIIYISHYYYKYFTRENPLPGPIPLPLVGNLFRVWYDISVWPSELQEKYGDFYEVCIGSKRLIWLCRDDLVRKIMKPTIRSNFHDLVSADNDGLKEIGLLDVGLVYNTNYETWEYYRRFYAKTIMKPSFMIQALCNIQNVFKEMENYWEQLGEDTVFEFSKWSKRFITDTIISVTANKSAHSLTSYYNSISIGKKINVSESILKESDTFIEAVDSFIMSFFYFIMFPKFIRDFPGVKRYTQKLKRHVNWMRNEVRNIIKARREEIERTPEDQKLSNDLLTMFLTINTPRDITEKIADRYHDQPLSDEEICGNLLEALGGGIDTTSNFICLLIHHLSSNPKVKERLIEEIDRVLGKDPNYQITYEDAGKLKYCEAVINECSRITPVAPVMLKKNTNPDEVGGLTFPANTQFFINSQGIHNNKSSWTNPEEFNPERFMDKTNPESKNPLYTFGGGLKICPGKNLAMLNLKVTLALLYGKYDIEPVAPMKYFTTSVISCYEQKVLIKKRKNI